jgi:hypothetical protein
MTKSMERNLAFAAFVTLLILSYAILSADCATGGSCALANGDLASWFFPKLQTIEGWFWKIVSG